MTRTYIFVRFYTSIKKQNDVHHHRNRVKTKTINNRCSYMIFFFFETSYFAYTESAPPSPHRRLTTRIANNKTLMWLSQHFNVIYYYKTSKPNFVYCHLLLFCKSLSYGSTFLYDFYNIA